MGESADAGRVSEIGTHLREDMAERPGITRRKILKMGGKVIVAVPAIAAISAASALTGAAGVMAANVAGELLKSKAEVDSREVEGKFPVSGIGVGKFEFLKDKNLHLRESPELDKVNIIDWNDVAEVEGIDITGADRFTVENLTTVEGQNPGLPTKSGKDSWFVFKVRRKGIVGKDAYIQAYASWSFETSDYIKDKDHNAKFIKINKVNKDGYKFMQQDGKPFNLPTNVVTAKAT